MKYSLLTLAVQLISWNVKKKKKNFKPCTTRLDYGDSGDATSWTKFLSRVRSTTAITTRCWKKSFQLYAKEVVCRTRRYTYTTQCEWLPRQQISALQASNVFPTHHDWKFRSVLVALGIQGTSPRQPESEESSESARSLATSLKTTRRKTKDTIFRE